MSTLTRAYPSLSLLTRQQCESVHLASLELLRRTGVRIHHREALDLLRQTDAAISDNNLVRFPAGLVEWALRQAPSSITLCKRGSTEAAIRLEGERTAYGTGSDCSHYLNPKTGKHELFSTETLTSCIRLVDSLPEIDFCMSMGVPADLDAGMSPFRYQYALLLQNTCKPVVFISGDRADCEAIVAMAAAAAGGMEQLRLNPTILSYSQATTPLQQPEDSLEKLLYMAEQGLPMVHQPSPMMGGTTPVSMASALAVGNAEVLSGLVIAQLKRRGTPCVYGQGLHHMDMRTTISVYGAPEFELARLAVSDLARYYDLPNFGYAGYSDSPVMDEQAATDAVASIMVAEMSGQHLAHDIGYLEAGMTTSPEMIVFCAEVIERTRHFSAGFSLDDPSFALDLVDRLGPGGQYLTEEHTLTHFRELWQPISFTRQRLDNWQKKGSRRLGDRLRDRTIAVMEAAPHAPLPASLSAEIDYILKSGKATRS